jgi:hypothetical protein
MSANDGVVALIETLEQHRTLREQLEARGEPALARRVKVARGDHGQAQRVRRFLLGLYNGETFKCDMTELRCLDNALQRDVLAVLAMDMDGPSKEVHNRPGAAVIATWAAEDWPAQGTCETQPRLEAHDVEASAQDGA